MHADHECAARAEPRNRSPHGLVLQRRLEVGEHRVAAEDEIEFALKNLEDWIAMKYDKI